MHSFSQHHFQTPMIPRDPSMLTHSRQAAEMHLDHRDIIRTDQSDSRIRKRTDRQNVLTISIPNQEGPFLKETLRISIHHITQSFVV